MPLSVLLVNGGWHFKSSHATRAVKPLNRWTRCCCCCCCCCCWVFPHPTAGGGRPFLLFWCFLHYNTSTATQPDVSYARRHVGATQQDVCGWVVCFWVGVGWGWVGGGVGGMFPFVAFARILMLRNMMFLAREHIFTESICTSMEHWREKPSDDDDFLIKHIFLK